MQSNEQIFRHVSRRIAQIESGHTHVLHHFTPRYKNRTLVVDCWCGVSFASAYIDRHDLEDFISWINEHAPCPPKEPKPDTRLRCIECGSPQVVDGKRCRSCADGL